VYEAVQQDVGVCPPMSQSARLRMKKGVSRKRLRFHPHHPLLVFTSSTLFGPGSWQGRTSHRHLLSIQHGQMEEINQHFPIWHVRMQVLLDTHERAHVAAHESATPSDY
jgi:hypothetical protein